jgi:tetratricopeptide (TPR) repeat protein
VRRVDLELPPKLGDVCVDGAREHVGGVADLQGMDFATDEKATKRTARVMLRMVEEINNSYLKRVETDRPETTRVRCITCHHGLTVPKSIDEILTRSIEAKGVAAALTEYRELREKYYGSAAYDFSQGPLNYIVEKLSREKKADDALAVVNANIELNPQAAYPHVLLSRLRLARGEKDQAIAELRKAVELDPTNAFVKKQLDELTAPAPSPSPK